MLDHAVKCSSLLNANAVCDCDGYHTFNELYEHRHVLWLKLCEMMKAHTAIFIWASLKHSDGSCFDGWFIMGINMAEGEQMSYHLPMRFWDKACVIADILDVSPEFDGHTSDDVINRLSTLHK